MYLCGVLFVGVFVERLLIIGGLFVVAGLCEIGGG